MAYPMKNEFVKFLGEKKLRDLVQEYVFTGVPYAFRDAEGDYEALRSHLAVNLQLPVEDLTIVGSGRIGFSLEPDTFGIPFGPEKDLDVVVWLELLRMSPAQFGALSRQQKKRVNDHRQNEIYWGRLWPANLLGIAPSARRWVEAFRGISRNPRLAYHETNGRLYRTWDHAQIYHMYGLQQLRLVLSHRE